MTDRARGPIPETSGPPAARLNPQSVIGMRAGGKRTKIQVEVENRPRSHGTAKAPPGTTRDRTWTLHYSCGA